MYPVFHDTNELLGIQCKNYSEHEIVSVEVMDKIDETQKKKRPPNLQVDSNGKQS